MRAKRIAHYIAQVAVTVSVRAWVLSMLWRWFIVDTWPRTPSPSVAQAAGVLFVVAVLRATPTDMHARPPVSQRDSWEATLASIVFALVTLGFGWVVQAIS